MDRTFKECRKRLALLWFGAAGVLFATLIAQTFGGALGTDPSKSWGWFLPNLMPTLMLVASSLIPDATPPGAAAAPEPLADRTYYGLAMAVSAFYLFALLVVMLGWRATEYDDPLKVMTVSSLFIAPIQGLAAAIIGIFFKRSGSDKKP